MSKKLRSDSARASSIEIPQSRSIAASSLARARRDFHKETMENKGMDAVAGANEKAEDKDWIMALTFCLVLRGVVSITDVDLSRGVCFI